jgi:hypothetical protein
MTEQHPITPPPELVEQWAQMTAKNDIVLGNWVYIATQAAELEGAGAAGVVQVSGQRPHHRRRNDERLRHHPPRTGAAR